MLEGCLPHSHVTMRILPASKPPKMLKNWNFKIDILQNDSIMAMIISYFIITCQTFNMDLFVGEVDPIIQGNIEGSKKSKLCILNLWKKVI